MEIESRLVDFALNADPTDAARQMMRLSLLDWSACALAGQGEDVSQIVRRSALADGGAEHATVIGASQKLSARAAALINGTTSHALDYDDTHFAHIGHPSVAVIPAVLAVAERSGAKGGAFLDAALIGVEASVRIGMWLGRAHYQAGFHQTATAGAFGATLGVARLLGLSVVQAGHALGLASTTAAGLKSQFGSMGKPLNAGLAASAAVQSVDLAVAGMKSSRLGLSGAQGFGMGHHGEANENALSGIGQDWQFEDISHKFHACCHGLHAMLEALASIRGTFKAADIYSLTIITSPRWQAVCDQQSPENGLEVKFSYRHTAAMALAGIDTAALGSYSTKTAMDPRLAALAERVHLVFDPAVAETAAQVIVSLTNGSEIAASHDLSAPLPISERQQKLWAKSETMLGPERANTLWRAINPKVDLPAFLASLAG